MFDALTVNEKTTLEVICCVHNYIDIGYHLIETFFIQHPVDGSNSCIKIQGRGCVLLILPFSPLYVLLCEQFVVAN